MYIYIIISGWWFQQCFIFHNILINIWDVILPIDYFSRWLLHHQPDIFEHIWTMPKNDVLGLSSSSLPQELGVRSRWSHRPFFSLSSHWVQAIFLLVVLCFIGLVLGNIYRKAPCLMGKSMVSCRFSQQNQSIECCFHISCFLLEDFLSSSMFQCNLCLDRFPCSCVQRRAFVAFTPPIPTRKTPNEHATNIEWQHLIMTTGNKYQIMTYNYTQNIPERSMSGTMIRNHTCFPCFPWESLQENIMKDGEWWIEVMPRKVVSPIYQSFFPWVFLSPL